MRCSNWPTNGMECRILQNLAVTPPELYQWGKTQVEIIPRPICSQVHHKIQRHKPEKNYEAQAQV